MKAICTALLCLVSALNTIYAQKLSDDQVPALVREAFKQKFPHAKDASWELEDNSYEASFKINAAKHSASFDKTGKWEETETEMKVSELPVAIAASINKQYAGYKIKEAEKVESAKHGKCYEVEIDKEKDSWELLVNSKGEVLAKKAEKEDKDEVD